MDNIVTTILTAIGASGIVGVIVTLIITKKVNQEFEKADRREKMRDENMLLMMSRIDNTAEMTHMMARKLHDAGVINGDLQELDAKYKELNEKYDNHMRRLAIEVLNK